jgi:hypothetical protein
MNCIQSFTMFLCALRALGGSKSFSEPRKCSHKELKEHKEHKDKK